MTNLGTAIWLEASYRMYLAGPANGQKPAPVTRQHWLAWLFPTWRTANDR